MQNSCTVSLSRTLNLVSGGRTAADPDRSSPVPLGSGRGGPVRSALRRAVAEAREAGSLSAVHEVRIAMAMRYADVVDRAARDSDASALLRAGDKLLELLAALPVLTPGGGAEVDGHGDGRAIVLELLDSPPQVGNG